MASFEISINYMLDKINRFIGVSHRSKSGRLSKDEIIAAATSAINKKAGIKPENDKHWFKSGLLQTKMQTTDLLTLKQV